MDTATSMLEKHPSAVLTGSYPDKLSWCDLGITCTNHIKSRRAALSSTFENTCHAPVTCFCSIFFRVPQVLFKVTRALNISAPWTFWAVPVVFNHLFEREHLVSKMTFSSELCLGVLFMRTLTGFKLSGCPWLFHFIPSSHYSWTGCEKSHQCPALIEGEISKPIIFSNAGGTAVTSSLFTACRITVIHVPYHRTCIYGFACISGWDKRLEDLDWRKNTVFPPKKDWV